MPEAGAAVEGVSESYALQDTGTTLYSAYNFLKCTSDRHVAPTSTQDVSDLVKELLTATSSRPVKVRATRHDFHCMNGFVCPGHRANTKREFSHTLSTETPASVTLLLHLMNRVIAVDTAKSQLTVGAGITLQAMVDAAEANGMSVPAGVMPAYGNLSLGGVISTSAHGSGLGTASTLGDLVAKLTWVNGRGEIVVSKAGSPEVAALVGGLGLLGVLTEVTLQLHPRSYTVVESRNNLDDNNMVAELTSLFASETPNILVQWKPEFREYRAVLYKEVDAVPDGLTFRPHAKSGIMHAPDDDTARLVKQLLAAWDADPDEESPLADVLNTGICGVGRSFFSGSFLIDEDGTPLHNATVTTNNAMLAQECAPKCSTQTKAMGAVTDDVSFTIKFSQLQEWVNDVRAVVQAEMEKPQARLNARYGDGKVARCTSPGLIWLRFGQKSSNLIAMNAGDEDVVYAQWSTMQSAMTPNRPSKHAAIIETLEQMNLCKYGARPHWGKNYERVFRHPDCPVRDNFPAANVAQLLELQERHDPAKLFQPELFQHVLDRCGPVYAKECTLTYACYCREDVHCPEGYVCRPSQPFPMYNICKRPDLHHNAS
jgi:hypothetical protein